MTGMKAEQQPEVAGKPGGGCPKKPKKECFKKQGVLPSNIKSEKCPSACCMETVVP